MAYKLKLPGVKTELNTKPLNDPDDVEEDDDELNDACIDAAEEICQGLKKIYLEEESLRHFDQDDVSLRAQANKVAKDFGVDEDDEKGYEKIENLIHKAVNERIKEILW